MKKIKKTVSVLLSLIMIFALFAIVPVTASAATQNVTFIGEDAFEGCDSLKEVFIRRPELLEEAGLPEGIRIITE